MFEQSSRYTNCKDATITDEYGRLVRYKLRRFIQPSTSMKVIHEVTVAAANDRLDVISARTLGDPEQFWRICDSNDAFHPLDLTSEIGKRLQIAMPWSYGDRHE
jgi:hypothetical protein